MFIAGVGGCHAGWIAFKVELPSLATTVEVIDLYAILRNKPDDIAYLAIDIPIGLFDGSRACDKAARKLLGQPRGTSVFAAHCRAALMAKNRHKTGKGLSQQAFGIGSKIKQVDDVITPDCQQWAFEVHPEICFWALNGMCSMAHNKKTKEGVANRLALLSPVFPDIHRHLVNLPPGVGER
jgi:predicted RNase H-like nuclease